MKAIYMLALAVISAGLIGGSTSAAFGHAHLTLTPDIEHVNPIVLTLGHTNEPTYGAKPGIHDGKHGLELSIEDERTAMPLAGAQLRVDKFYFQDMRSFNRASTPLDATEVQLNVTLGGVFGEPGHYMSRQVQKDGIYGYRVYGTIDYFGVAQLPIDTTVFCNAGVQGNTSKFNSEGWHGSYGCTQDIDGTLFPKNNAAVTSASLESGNAEIQQAGLDDSTLQMLSMAGISGTAVAAFFGVRKLKNRG